MTVTLSLFVSALVQSMQTSTGLYLSAYTDLTCKLYWYISCIIRSSSGWVLVVVTGDRIINMAKPYLVETICTKKNASVFLLCLLACISACYIPVLLDGSSNTFLLFDENNKKFWVEMKCLANPKSAHAWVDMFLHCLMPFISMLLGNVVIVVLL